MEPLPTSIIGVEVSKYLDFSGLLALRLTCWCLYNQIDSQEHFKRRIVPGLQCNKWVLGQIESNREELEMMNPLQLKCVIEEICFNCELLYSGPICLPLRVYGHEKCIEKLLISALKPDCNGYVPVNYLPENFPAIVNPKKFYTCVTGRVEPIYETCFVVSKRHTKIEAKYTLEGFLQANKDLPRLCGVEYSPKRFRKRPLCPEAPRKVYRKNLRRNIDKYPVQLLSRL